MKQFSADCNEENGWIKAMRNPAVIALMHANPLAFVLASVIALRGRYYEGFNKHNLALGEAMLGDYAAYGMTEQQYRTAKHQLQEWGFATFRSTSRGTIGKLIDTRLYTISKTPPNGQSNERPTDEQRTGNGRATTNKEYKEGKNEKKGEKAPPDSWKVNKDLAEVDRLIEKECAKQKPDRDLVRSWQSDRRKLVALKKAAVLPVIAEAVKVSNFEVVPKETPLKDVPHDEFQNGLTGMREAVENKLIHFGL